MIKLLAAEYLCLAFGQYYFEQADPRYQLAVVVAQYAEMLHRSPWAAGAYASQLVEHAYRVSSLLWDDSEVTEFASLVSRVNQIRGAFRILFPQFLMRSPWPGWRNTYYRTLGW
jgi:hypothetical protein